MQKTKARELSRKRSTLSKREVMRANVMSLLRGRSMVATMQRGTVLFVCLFIFGLYACGHDQRGREVSANSDTNSSTGGRLNAPNYEGIPIPGTFEAEHFVRAFERGTEQEGDAECVNPVSEFVDIGASDVASGGCSIGYTVSGEWLEYDLAVPQDGAYDFTLALATQLPGRTVSISIDGTHRGTIAVPATDWLDFQELTLEGVGLTEGTRVLRVTFDTGAVNFDYTTVSEASACIPACEHKTCGVDFCGGTCGTCESDQECNSANMCVGPFQSPVTQHGKLRTEGSKILDENGEVVQLRGVSTQWLNWEQVYSGNSQNMEFMRDTWGLTVYRIANGVENNNGYADPEVRPQRLARVKEMIDTAIDLDIYVIVDWHSHLLEHKDLAIEFFSEIAEEYGDNPHLIYEVFNEPIGPSDGAGDFWADELKPYHEELVAAIRAHDPDNLIVLGTPRWAQEVGIAAANPVGGDNLLYSLHFYSCTHSGYLRDRAENAMAAGIALFVTEWGSTHADGGTPNNPGVCLTEALAWHNFLDEKKVSSAAWKLASDQDASAILNNAPPNGPWLDEHLTPHGIFVREVLQRP